LSLGTTLLEAQKFAFKVFDEINKAKGLSWNPFVIVTDLLEEAGEVASVVKGLEGYKPPDKPMTRGMLAVELSDLLFIVLVLAEIYGIKMEETYLKTVKGYRTRFL